MSKAKKITYWIATLWMALGMASTAIVQIFKIKTPNDFAANLGYPAYFLTIIGVWKLLGVIAILIPNFKLMKEWAYAGFFFVMSGAAISHIVTGTANNIFPSLLLLTLTVVSYTTRPATKKIVSINRVPFITLRKQYYGQHQSQS